MNMKNNNEKKVCIVGLDGTPFSLLKTLANDGVLPNLSRIFESGTFSPMTTALPEISSVAWTSFMTGKNPGKHNIFGFADLRPESYEMFFPNYLDMQSETLWDILSKNQKRSVIINMPSTYPAQELNGVLIAGFVAPNYEKAFYPSQLAEKFKEMDYRIDLDLEKALQSKDFLINDIEETHERRERAILSLMENEEWDLFTAVITETDRLHHFLWDELENSDSHYREAFIKYYKRVDNFLGKMNKKIDDDTLFVIVSDHGFCKVNKQVYLNHWLERAGYLSYRVEDPRFVMDIDGNRTKAFCMDPGRIYLNMKNRFTEGVIEEADYESVREELRDAILALRYPDNSGEKIIKHVHKKEEIYDGPYLEKAPDLVVEAAPGFDLKGSVAKKVLFENGPWTGMHTSDDATFYINKKIDASGVRIFDIAPTVLKYFDIDPPTDMDGRVLL